MSTRKSVFHRFCSTFLKNDKQYNETRLYNHFSLIATNRFKWSNLPEGIESRHIEKFLYENGQVSFFEDNLLGFLALPSSVQGVNVYGDPTSVIATGINYSKSLKINEQVRILANDRSMSLSNQVLYYAQLIDYVEDLMFKNLKQMQQPYIISTTKNNELTMKNLMKKLDDGEEAIFIDERLSQGGDVGVKVIQTDVQYRLDKLQAFKNDLMSELYTLLGVNNTTINKKAQVNLDEININNNEIMNNIELEFKNRELACSLINEKFNLNITVEKTIDLLDFKDLSIRTDTDTDDDYKFV